MLVPLVLTARVVVVAWWAAGRRGLVVLPTGAGKSFVAELCIARGLRARPDDARLLAIAGSRSPS